MKTIHYIPLGTCCSASFVLKQLDLRRQSLPFDWIELPCSAIASLITMPQDNIEGVVSDYIDKIRSQRHPDGSYFPHHFIATSNYEKQQHELKQRFTILFKRLFKILNSDDKCVFLTVFPQYKKENDIDYYDLIILQYQCSIW